MDKMSLDLATERINTPIIMKRWKYIFVGECTGTITLKLGSITASPLDPNEFEKISGLEDYYFLFINNAGGQTGKVLNIYFEEEAVGEDVEIEKD